MKKALLVATALSSLLFAKNISVTYKEYPTYPLKSNAAVTMGLFDDLPDQVKAYEVVDHVFKDAQDNHHSCYFNGASYHNVVKDSLNGAIRKHTDADVVTPEYAEYIISGSMYDQSVMTDAQLDPNTNVTKASRRAALATTFYLLDVKTGDTLYSKLIESGDVSSATGSSAKAAGAACKDPHVMHTKLCGSVALGFCREIFCIETTAKIFIDKGKGKEFKAATLAALEGNWEAAIPVWEKFVQDKKTKKDALWNLFQYNYYVKQDFTKAAALMKDLYAIKDRRHFKRLMDQATQQAENKKKYEALSM